MTELEIMSRLLESEAAKLLLPRAYPHYTEVEHNIVQELINNGARVCSNMLEVAISKIGRIEHDPAVGRDFADGSDAKFSTVRLSGSRYSANVSGFANKGGLLRIYVYERLQQKEYFFVVPYDIYKNMSDIEIPFTKNGFPKNQHESQWWKYYQVSTFDELSKEDMSPPTLKDEVVPQLTVLVLDKEQQNLKHITSFFEIG